jgi:hypothetical protein
LEKVFALHTPGSFIGGPLQTHLTFSLLRQPAWELRGKGNLSGWNYKVPPGACLESK